MSLTVTTDITCDRCHAWTHGVVTGGPVRAKQARRIAASWGWARRRVDGRMIDLCPECQEPHLITSALEGES